MIDLNIVIPMAGEGSRFAEQGYTYPKPLCSIFNKPMIQVVYETLPQQTIGKRGYNDIYFDCFKYHFIVKKEHNEKYHINSMLLQLNKDADITEIEETTQGSLCSILSIEDKINNDTPLLIANSDQYVRINWTTFMNRMRDTFDADGGIVTFRSIHPKFSYVRIDNTRLDSETVIEVKEKVVISNQATAGIYYFKHGSDFVKYAHQMIDNNDRFNNEFYIAPVYNYFIKDGKDIKAFNIDYMQSLGTPEDLQLYINNYDRFR